MAARWIEMQARPANRWAATIFVVAALLAASRGGAAPDAAFTRWLESLWPQAQEMGVSRKTFTSSTHGLEPDLTLPDLEIPGRPGQPQRGQAEFVQTPADYVKETIIARLA